MFKEDYVKFKFQDKDSARDVLRQIVDEVYDKTRFEDKVAERSQVFLKITSKNRRDFIKVACNTLVRKSKRDFWEIVGTEQEGKVLVVRKVDEYENEFDT